MPMAWVQCLEWESLTFGALVRRPGQTCAMSAQNADKMQSAYESQ